MSDYVRCIHFLAHWRKYGDKLEDYGRPEGDSQLLKITCP